MLELEAQLASAVTLGLGVQGEQLAVAQLADRLGMGSSFGGGDGTAGGSLGGQIGGGFGGGFGDRLP